MIVGEYVFENGRILGRLKAEPGWQPFTVTYNRDGRVKDVFGPTWVLMIEDYATGKIIYRDAEGLTTRLVSESERMSIENEREEKE